MPIEAEALSDETATLDDAKLAELQATFHDPVIAQGDDGYDEVRAVQNGLIDRRPALVMRCRVPRTSSTPSIWPASTVC
ncbi:hypothetical protein [Streptosporangium sp. NPDC006007]|uniref:hypothetical protein n=1 Tax=Streptosporangium sp. NPDC006007 TaxID=3154575 RepID=UPI0033A57D70